MSTVSAIRPAVQIPRDSDGYLVPSLLPVAAYLCVEEYADEARARILERLADGVSPRDCARDGLIEWRDLAEIERLCAGRRPYRTPLPPIAGGAPTAADEFPRKYTDAEYRQAIRDMVAEHAEQVARIERLYPLDADGAPAWSPTRTLAEMRAAE